VRTPLLASLATLVLCAACGQKGPLVLPQKSVATPVVIRAPASDAVPPAAPAPDAGPPAQRKDDEPKAPPQR
jgi:predicted small lipoprotein YifL